MIPMIHGLHWVAPGWLWLLPVLLPLVWRWNRGKSPYFKLLQLSCCTLLILAAAKPECLYDATVRKRLLLWEKTGSLEPAPKEYDNRELREFTGSTAAALAGAAADIPDGGGSILLIGNLQESDHALDAVLETLNRRRISVTARPPASGPEREQQKLFLREITLPTAAGVGATIPIDLNLDATTAGTARFSIALPSGETVLEQSATFSPGSFRITLPLPLPHPGMFRGRIEINGVSAGEIALQVRDAFRAVLFSRDPEREFGEFQPVFGNAVRLETYRPGMKLDDAPLLIFGAGSVRDLTEEKQREIVRLAKTGTGLLAVAGREAVFAEETLLPEFAQLFPLRYPGTQEKRIPTVALAVVIDTSGSMRGPRLDLARETARLAIAGLQEHDLAGIVEFHGARRWAAPLQSAANQFSLMRALNRLNAGGGTVILPAIHEAYYALRNTDARLKHLLILTDGGVEYGDFESILRQMAQHDITVSTVLVGPGESDFLSRLAMWGGGRFYRASSRFALPELQFREQENQPRPPVREETMTILPAPETLTSELPSDLRIGGLVQSIPVHSAEILLHAGELPLLAVQENAPSRCAVWNSEWNGPWSADFLRAPEASAMLRALARTLPDPLKFTGITAWNRSSLRDFDFEFETSLPVSELKLQLTEITSDRIRQWRLAPSSRGTFRLRIPDLPEGTYRIQPEGFSDSFYFVSRQAPAGGAPNHARIDQINRTAIPESSAQVRTRYPLSPTAAVLAAILFLSELAWRRRGVMAGLLLFLGAISLHGAAFEEQMREALQKEEERLFDAASSCYRQASGAATSDTDRAFAEILARETARRNGKPGSDRDSEEAAPQEKGDALQEAVRLALLDGDRQSALKLYTGAIESFNDPKKLAQLAEAAAAQGLFDPAENALRKALTLPAESPDWTLLFQLATLYRRRGEPEKAVAELRRATAKETTPSPVLLTAGDLCEQAGNPTAAMEFFRRAGSEDARFRLAQLEELHGSFENAAGCYLKIAEESKSSLRAQQAMERLVELYRKQNRLQELLSAEKPGLSEGRLHQLHLQTLAATGDRAALYEFLDQHGTPEEALQYRLAARDYAGAATLLKQRLNRTDPAAEQSREAWLRQLAMVAVEQKDSELAAETLEKLLALHPNDAALWEFAGAVRNLTGDPREAAAAYERALRLAPEKSELLLLWGKARCQAGETAAVLAFFTQAYPQEKNLERFGILLDGLLNFNAPHQTLRAALQEVLRRLRLEPETLFYYQLAEDLAGELGDRKTLTRLARLQMIVAPERRTLLTQHCFLDALQAGEREEALFYGRLLLAYDDSYSPEITRELGRLFVENHLYREAERCMRNADRTQETDANLSALASIYASAGKFPEAERLYRELLALAPNRIDLLESYARILEFQGRIHEAAESNFQALRLQARRQNDDREWALVFRIRNFVNQALYQADSFRKRIDMEIQCATTESGRKLWRQAKQRLDALTVPLGDAPKRNSSPTDVARPRQSAHPRPNARRTLQQLRSAAPEEEEGILREAFAAYPEKSRELFWRQLVAAFDFEPSAATTEFLLKKMEGFSFEIPLMLNWPLPFARKLKSAYAESALTRNPDALAAREFAARMRHLNGDGEGARAMAELCYDQLDDSAEPLTIADIRHLMSLNQVYADAPGEPSGRGRAALLEQIARQDEKRELLGETPFRWLLGGILRTGDDRYDEAQEHLSRAWDADRDSFALLWALNQLLEETENREPWMNLLLQRIPNDQTTRTLYAIALIPQLRNAGRLPEAQKLLFLLNPTLQLREKLLFARQSGDAGQMEAAFLEFLQSNSAYLIPDSSASSGGILALQTDFRTRSSALFSEIASEIPSIRPFLEYQLQGLLPNEAGFAELLQTLRRLPPLSSSDESREQKSVWPAPPRTLARLLQESTGQAQELSAAERSALRNFAQSGGIAPEVLTALLAALPESDRISVAPDAMRQLLREVLPPAPSELEPLLRFFSPTQCRELCKEIAPYDQGSEESELRKLLILHQFAPELCEARIRDTEYPPGSALTLLAAPSRERCRNYLLLSGETPPDWQRLKQLMKSDEALAERTDAFCAELEELASRGVLSRSQQVRHYALLAVYDAPSRRPLRLRAARQAHRHTGEASLWLLDALQANQQQKEAAQLTDLLRREGKLPPNRKQSTIPSGGQSKSAEEPSSPAPNIPQSKQFPTQSKGKSA